VNSEQLANEVQHLRQNSSTFRALETAAAAAGYKTIEIRMGAGVLRHNIADSLQTDPSTRTIRINSDVTGSWGVGGRQATVGEMIAHELAHAVVPQEFSERGVYDPMERGVEGMWVRRQAGQVARDLGLPGENNADHPITRISVNEIQGCTKKTPQGDGARDGVLFLDGSRGYHGIGASVPSAPGAQDPVNSRRLAADEVEQGELTTGPDAASGRQMRYLGRRIAGDPDTSVFSTGASAVPFVPPNEFRSSGFLVDRFGNGSSSAGSVSPNRGQPMPSLNTNRPLGLVSGQQMLEHRLPASIWGLPDGSEARDEDSDWLMRLLRSAGSR
jgi:hypothetical protein